MESFGPEYLANDAKMSGFFHCPECQLFWFGKPDAEICPNGHPAFHVAAICRYCDRTVPIELIPGHLGGEDHLGCVEMEGETSSSDLLIWQNFR